jgi:hypothetical protein
MMRRWSRSSSMSTTARWVTPRLSAINSTSSKWNILRECRMICSRQSSLTDRYTRKCRERLRKRPKERGSKSNKRIL